MMARIHLFPYPAPFPAWITAAEHYWALLPRAEGSRPDVRISSETRPDSFPSIYLEVRGPASGTVFPSRFCREGAEGFLFSIPHPDEETVRHAGCEARQGIGAASSEPDYPDTGLASGSHSRPQAVAVGARGGSAVPFHAGRKRPYSTPRTASVVTMWGGDYLIRGAWIASDSTRDLGFTPSQRHQRADGEAQQLTQRRIKAR